MCDDHPVRNFIQREFILGGDLGRQNAEAESNSFNHAADDVYISMCPLFLHVLSVHAWESFR